MNIFGKTVHEQAVSWARSRNLAPKHARDLDVGSAAWWEACDVAFKHAMRQWAIELRNERLSREGGTSCQT